MLYNIVFNCFTIVSTGIGGSLLYDIVDGLYKNSFNHLIIKRKRNIFPIYKSFQKIINPGFFVGIGLGISYVITEKPFVYNFI